MAKLIFKPVMMALLLSAASAAAWAQERPEDATTDVEVEPITCWWRTTTSAVRSGEPFGLTLTCSVVEAEATTVVPDLSRLDPTVVQLPPFEVLGGTHPGDLTVPGKRFFQYDYKLRVIAEEALGVDVAVPPLEITYRIESKVSGGDSVQGRDLTYSLPAASMRVLSLVPNDATDIREAPAVGFGDIESRVSRANLMQTAATLLFAVAGFLVLIMLIGVVRRRTATTRVVRHLPAPRAILAGVARELAAVKHESRGGWTPELGGRALAALRIAGSYATNRSVGQRLAGRGDRPLDGQLAVRGGMGRAGAFVSGSVTPESAGAVPGLNDALRTLTLWRYGRSGEVSGSADEAVETAIRLTREQAARHSLVAEWTAALVASAVDLRKKVWA